MSWVEDLRGVEARFGVGGRWEVDGCCVDDWSVDEGWGVDAVRGMEEERGVDDRCGAEGGREEVGGCGGDEGCWMEVVDSVTSELEMVTDVFSAAEAEVGSGVGGGRGAFRFGLVCTESSCSSASDPMPHTFPFSPFRIFCNFS